MSLFVLSDYGYSMPLENINRMARGAEGGEKTLIMQTLSQDIETASYYELIAWCKRLNLPETGSRKELQRRLLSYYKIETEKTIEKRGRIIEVESAKEAEYFDLNIAKEKYVTLRGDVVVKMIDNEKNVTHLIKANVVTLNETKNLLTASGNLEYHLIKPAKEEVFRGESLNFNIDTWEGIFFKGKTERETNLGGKKGTFFFSGREMSRSSNDIVTLSQGSVTSCNLEQAPHYRIQAKKLWILAPGEWAVQNATLYIGRVPIMIIPYFFYPGDKLFFHPSLGYRSREGNYIQTTTYLIGQKEQKSDIFSLLKIEGSNEGTYEEELRGLFLRKTGKTVESINKDYLKLFFDIYSKLGIFSGLEGKFSSGIDFKGGVAYSRDIFLDEVTGFYTPIFPDENGNPVSYWNHSSIFGLDLPLRYGMSANLKHSFGDFSISGSFESYSDPFFPSDFYNRSEGMDFDSILGLTPQTTSNVGTKNNLTWFLKGQGNLKGVADLPFVSSFTIPYINFQYFFQSREIEDSINNKVLEVDPSRKFYYPANMTTPQLSLSVTGDIFKWKSNLAENSGRGAKPPSPNKRNSVRKAVKDQGKGFRIDIPVKPEVSEVKKKVKMALVEPQPMKDVSLSAYVKVSNIDVGYQLKPRLDVVSTFDSSDWLTGDEVDYSLLYSKMTVNDYTKLFTNMGIFGGLFSLNQSIDLNAIYNVRNRFSDSISDSEWANLLLNDYKQRNLNFREALKLSLSPFFDNQSLKGTNITYNLNMLLYKYSYLDSDQWGNPIYAGEIPKWDGETFQNHSVTGTMSLVRNSDKYKLSISYQLPPLDQLFTGTIDISAWITQTTLKESFSLENGVITYQPIILNENLTFTKDLSLSINTQYDITDYQFKVLTLKTNLWGVKASLNYQYMYPVDPIGNQISDTEVFLPTVIRFDYSNSGNKYFFWRDRIYFEPALSTYWFMDIQRFSNNEFNFNMKFNFFIYKFMEISFSSVSYNRRTYLYFPSLAEKVGVAPVNPIYDLLRSFNFFNVADRYASSFKIKNLSLRVVHHLHDWDVSLEYVGSPQLKTLPDGSKQYQWTPSLSINIQWNAIPNIKSNLREDEEGIHIRG